MSEVPPFPYKREFIDAKQLYNNAVNLNLVSISYVDNHPRWIAVPGRYDFFQLPNGEKRKMALVVDPEAYERVNKLVDVFSEPSRMVACRKDHISPFDFYTQNFDQIQRKASELAQKDPSSPFRHHLREAVYSLTNECTTFKISVTKALFQLLKSKVVLDPSAGWGDRLLGAAAAGVTVYHGIDPNPSLRSAYDEMLNFIRNSSSTPSSVQIDQYAVITEDFLKVQLDPNRKYDTVFTSPPFFDYEIYSEDGKQSITGRNTVDLWLRNFFFPYLKKAWEALISGGHLAIYISDTKNDRYVEKMYQYVTRELKGQYLGILSVTDPDLRKGYPIWIWKKS